MPSLLGEMRGLDWLIGFGATKHGVAVNFLSEKIELLLFAFLGLPIHKELMLSSNSESESSFASFWYLLNEGLINTLSETELGLLLMTELTQNVEFSLGFDQRLSVRGVNDLPLIRLLFSGLTVSFDDSERL